MATYDIIGAGSSSGNPVTVFMGCEDSVNICWTGRQTVDAYCSECYYLDSQYCQIISNVTESTTGTISWEGKTVYYKIVKNCEPEPVPQSCSTYTYSDFSFYTVPTYVEVDYEGYIDIYYSYTVTCLHADGSIGGIDNLSGMESVPFSSFTSGDTVYTYDFAPISDVCSACSGVAKVYIISDEDTCDSGITVDITTVFSPSVVPGLPSSGTDVTINVMSRKVEVNEDCTKVVTNSGDTLIWHVKCCSSCTENSGCCADHTVSSAFTMDYIKGLAGLTGDEDAVIRYNGVKVTSNLIPYSIIQKAKGTEECSASTEDKVTKYCVDSGSVLVEYETSYMSNEWSSGGTVPFEGGRIKVSWKYSACTYSCVDSACTAISCSDSAMTWEEIIDISSCDERAYCTPESEYDEDTDECKCTGSCSHACPDGECSYTCPNNDGEVSGNCVIYFKEYDSNCSSCGSGKPENNSDVIYNKIPYTFRQNCKGDCKSYSSITYDKQTISGIDKCFSATSSFTVSGTVTVGYIGFQCSPTSSYTTSATVEVDITPNNSNSARTVFEDDRIALIQDPGPCDDDTLCGAEVTLISGLTRGDYALVNFYSGETTDERYLQATYPIRSGETEGYYSDFSAATVVMDSDPDNNNDYIYKYYDSTKKIPSSGVLLGCGEGLSKSLSAVAETYCACKKLKGVTGGTVPATGDSGIEVATYSATTCTGEWKLGVMAASEDTPNIIDLSTIEFDDDNGVLKATVNSACTERTGDYVIYNTVTSTSCKTGSFTVTQSAYECGCSDMNFDVSPSSVEIGQAQGSSAEVTISNYGCCLPYSATVVEGGTWLDASLDGNKVTITTLAANPEVATRTGTVKFIAVEGGSVCNDGSSIEVTQAGAECNCGNMHFEVSPSAVTLGSEAGSMAEVSITNYVCIPPYSDMDDWLDITLNESEDKFIISSKTANESSEERVGIIEFKFNEGDEPCSSPTITVTQSAREIPDCPTDYLIGLAGGNISAGGGEYELARFKNDLSDYTTALTATMSDGSSASITDSSTTYSEDSTYNVIKVSVPANQNEDTRTISVGCTLTHTEGTPVCTDTKTFTQDGAEPTPTCGCNSITFNGGEFEEDEYEGIPVYRIEIDKSSQRITAATIDSDCTPRNRSLDKYETITTNNDWEDIVNGDSTPGDTELVLVINANNASSSREGYGKIMYDIDGTECTTIIHLVQSGTVTVCDCNNVTWKGTEEADPT